MSSLGLSQALRLVPRSRDELSELTCITTSACNFRCRHCFMIDELNKRSEELSADEMSRMSPSMPKMRRVHLGGGEPFAKRDITEKALIASNEWNSEIVCIPTNGWYDRNTYRTLEEFGKHGRAQLRVHFSINTLPDEMDGFTGVKGSFERWRETIRNAIEIGDRYENVTILCLATFNDDSKEVFAELKDYILEEIQPHDFSMQLAREHDNYHPELTTEDFDAVVRDYFRNDSQQPWFLTAYRELIREHTSACLHDSAQMPTCAAGSARLVIAPNGDVYPCEMKGYPNGVGFAQWRMGNVRDFAFDIQALLASPVARAVRERMASQACECQHGIDIALNLLHSPKFQAKVLWRGVEHAIHRKLRDVRAR
jgi:radical SAM protein with 4Fe4S-binding SPASM domain